MMSRGIEGGRYDLEGKMNFHVCFSSRSRAFPSLCLVSPLARAYRARVARLAHSNGELARWLLHMIQVDRAGPVSEISPYLEILCKIFDVFI